MDETLKMIELAHQGDKAARDRLVTDNLGLVWSIVKRFAGRGYEQEDLFQIGSIGLLKAIDKFDLQYQVRFSTYAVPMIAGEIRRFLRDDGMIKVSRSLKELAVKVFSLKEQLTDNYGREPTVEEIAKELGVSSEEVAASLEAGAQIESIYRPLSATEGEKGVLKERSSGTVIKQAYIGKADERSGRAGKRTDTAPLFLWPDTDRNGKSTEGFPGTDLAS